MSALCRTPLFATLCLSTALMIGRLLYVRHRRKVSARTRLEIQRRLNDRERTARAFQDRLLQSLHGLTLRFQVIADQTPTNACTYALINEALSEADAILVDASERGRNLQFTGGDLPGLLEQLADDACLDTRTTVEVLISSDTRELQHGIAQGVFQIAEQAVTNACRHAAAKRIQVSLIYAVRHLRLVVEDDGCGVDPPAIAQHKSGVARMRERASAFETELLIRSRPGHGTTISMAIPSRLAYTRRPAS